MSFTVGTNSSSIITIMTPTSDGGWVSVGPTLKSIWSDYLSQLNYEKMQKSIRYHVV